MPNVLAIDQSTSATKALLFDEAGRLLAKASRQHQQLYPKPGWVEHDGEEIWNNTLAAVGELAQEHADLIADTAWLSLTNQRETVVVFDRATGTPLHPAIVWQCRRGVAICERLKNEGHEGLVNEATGLKIDPYFSASKLQWLLENEPEVARRLTAGTAVAGTIDAYLITRMTGGEVFATDATNACRTLLYNIHTLGWDERLCELFSIPISVLPEVRDSDAEFGETDLDGVLPRKLPIRGVMGDSQASLFALGCHKPGEAKATIGTGCSLLMNLGGQGPKGGGQAVATIAWLRSGTPTYCAEGIINYSAATLEWLSNQLELIESAAESETLARSVEDNSGVYLVPAFAGLGAPYWKPDARAAIVGLSSHSSRAHVTRAAVESIAYQIRDALGALTEETGVSPAVLRVDGGAVANRFLMQFAADLLGVELRVARVAESSPLGAARCAAAKMGWEGFASETEAESEELCYAPGAGREAAEHAYNGWRSAVERVL